jgi:hypothetical protein
MDEGDEQQSVPRRRAAATTTGIRRDGASLAEQDVSTNASSRARCCSAAEDGSNPALGWRIPPRTPGGPLG